MVHANLARASLLMEPLVERCATLHDAYILSLRLSDELRLIARELGIELTTGLPAMSGANGVPEIAQQLLRATYEVFDRQARLRIPGSTIGDVSLAGMTPGKSS